MDWNIALFAARWVIIALFYLVLLVLLVGVYREASLQRHQQPGEGTITYGRLRVVQAGTDSHVPVGTIFDLTPITRLGAGQDNDIVLGDPFISRHHFKLNWDGVVWWLEDLNSKNGTRINNQACPPGLPQTLPGGAMIAVGDLVVELIE